MTARFDSDEAWVLDLCDAILGERSSRQHRFDWLRGDPSLKTGRRTRLPVDAYYPESGIVVEYRERQHFESVAHFDKPGRLTATGMSRREQRARYDALRERLIPEHGLQLSIVTPQDLEAKPNGRLRRRADEDLVTLVEMLSPRLRARKPRRKPREELGRREVGARVILNRALGVEVTPYDDGSLHGMVDSLFAYADGRRAVLEVTRVLDSDRAAQRSDSQSRNYVEGLSAAWYVRLHPWARIRSIHRKVSAALSRLEAEGVDRLDLDLPTIEDRSADPAELVRLGVRKIVRWENMSPGAVLYATSALVGVGASPSTLGAFLTDVVNDLERADNVSKLREHGDADERHLFIWLEFDQAIRWIPAFELGIPDDAPGPDIPKGITHVWLAASVSDVVMWSQATGWQRSANLRQTSLTAQGEH